MPSFNNPALCQQSPEQVVYVDIDSLTESSDAESYGVCTVPSSPLSFTSTTVTQEQLVSPLPTFKSPTLDTQSNVPQVASAVVEGPRTPQNKVLMSNETFVSPPWRAHSLPSLEAGGAQRNPIANPVQKFEDVNRVATPLSAVDAVGVAVVLDGIEITGEKRKVDKNSFEKEVNTKENSKSNDNPNIAELDNQLESKSSEKSSLEVMFESLLAKQVSTPTGSHGNKEDNDTNATSNKDKGLPLFTYRLPPKSYRDAIRKARNAKLEKSKEVAGSFFLQSAFMEPPIKRERDAEVASNNLNSYIAKPESELPVTSGEGKGKSKETNSSFTVKLEHLAAKFTENVQNQRNLREKEHEGKAKNIVPVIFADSDSESDMYSNAFDHSESEDDVSTRKNIDETSEGHDDDDEESCCSGTVDPSSRASSVCSPPASPPCLPPSWASFRSNPHSIATNNVSKDKGKGIERGVPGMEGLYTPSFPSVPKETSHDFGQWFDTPFLPSVNHVGFDPMNLQRRQDAQDRFGRDFVQWRPPPSESAFNSPRPAPYPAFVPTNGNANSDGVVKQDLKMFESSVVNPLNSVQGQVSCEKFEAASFSPYSVIKTMAQPDASKLPDNNVSHTLVGPCVQHSPIAHSLPSIIHPSNNADSKPGCKHRALPTPGAPYFAYKPFGTEPYNCLPAVPYSRVANFNSVNGNVRYMRPSMTPVEVPSLPPLGPPPQVAVPQRLFTPTPILPPRNAVGIQTQTPASSGPVQSAWVHTSPWRHVNNHGPVRGPPKIGPSFVADFKPPSSWAMSAAEGVKAPESQSEKEAEKASVQKVPSIDAWGAWGQGKWGATADQPKNLAPSMNATIDGCHPAGSPDAVGGSPNEVPNSYPVNAYDMPPWGAAGTPWQVQGFAQEQKQLAGLCAGNLPYNGMAGTVVKHAKYRFMDATVVFRVSNTTYHVHRHFFVQHSAYFRALLSSYPLTGSSDPIFLNDVTPLDFSRLLSVFYPNDMINYDLRSVDQWTSILTLASKWSMASIRTLAIDKIARLASPVQKLTLGKRYDVKAWLVPAYIDLLTHATPLSAQDAQQLDRDTLLKLWELKHQLFYVIRKEEDKGLEEAVRGKFGLGGE